MQYTEENVRKVLEKVDPYAYNAYANLAKMNLPGVIDKIFVVGFFGVLKRYHNPGIFFLQYNITPQDVDVLLRAYSDLHVSPGYFQFDEE